MKWSWLNLGRHFSIDRKAWPLLCERIKELLSGQSALGLEPLAPQCEAEARRITARLLQRQGEETTGADWETLDVASVCDSDGRCVGVEHAALAALDMLGLPGLFDELGFNRRQRCCALANIIARMAHPGSERATNRWLRATSATGELPGLDFGSVSDMALYRASDLLLFHQKRIEEHVFGTAQILFDLAPTITLYDLTNTFYEGQAAGQPKAQRGHSKEGRTDAPLLTLGLVLDASGFVRRSSVFAGNVTEATTLGAMLESLGASARRRSPTTSRPPSITPWASRHRRATSARPWSDVPSHPHQSAVCHPQHSACSEFISKMYEGDLHAKRVLSLSIEEVPTTDDVPIRDDEPHATRLEEEGAGRRLNSSRLIAHQQLKGAL